MRFQPSWVIESLQPHMLDSVFIPLAPRAETLLWFKKQGILLYVNDPLDSGATLLRAYLENQGETFSEENHRKCNLAVKVSPDLKINPFRDWEPAPFDRRQIDHLFFWREVAMEIPQKIQRDLFFSAVRSVLSYWLDLSRAGFPATFSCDEVMGYILNKQGALIFPSREKVFALEIPMDDLGEEVEAPLCLIPLRFQEKGIREFGIEEYYHAWFRGDGNLESARKSLEEARRGWVFRWEASPDFLKMRKKVGKATHVAVTWSGADLPPRFHEEHIAQPLKKVFSRDFPSHQLFFKTAERVSDDYDFLMIFHR